MTGEALAVQILAEAPELHNIFEVKLLDRTTQAMSFSGALLRTAKIFAQYLYFLLIFRPDVVYLSVGQKIRGILRDGFLIRLADILNINTIGHLHGGALRKRYEKAQGLIRWVLRKCHSKLSVGIVLGRSLMDQFEGILPTDRVRVVHNAPWDLAIEQGENSSKKLAKEEPLRILFFSNVLPEKGYFDVLASLDILKAKGVPFKFTFAGRYLAADGHSPSELREKAIYFIVKNKIEPWVEEVGFVQGICKWELLRSAHVFILPTYYYEGQPISMIEVLHAGCVIVCTNRGGIPDVVDEGIGGWFVSVGSPAAIAERLEWIWKHPEWFESASKHNIEKARMEFSVEQYVSKLVKIFLEVCENEANPPKL